MGIRLKEKDFLKVEKGKLLNRIGEDIYLHGVNLGGWLIQESWMCPISGEDRAWANLDTLEVLEKRFDKEKTQELLERYQDNWITQWDIENISKMGCNAIRVPFWYRNFMKDTKGTWIEENPNENPGFKRLDWVIKTAGKYGVYVILDMHGCPGGQSMDHCCGTLMKNDLYTEKVYQDTMEKLWVAIAERYKDNPVIAAYDIMNEPQNNSGYDGLHSYDPWESTAWEMTNQVYGRMIQAIQQVDENHVITVEGIWRVSNLPDPHQIGWTNMMYQTHLYDDDTGFEIYTNQIKDTMEQYGVAGYIGEFQNLNGLEMCNRKGIHWTTWSYKGTGNDVGSFFWYFGYVDKADVERDSFEKIKEKWGNVLRTNDTENFHEKTNVTKVIRKANEKTNVTKVIRKANETTNVTKVIRKANETQL